ncbi:MAG: hypothetical protein CL897_00040 [Dehalococcoidia bacterium]|nr:hypothetical protein [Dehalococcoidia bacterium]
MEELLRTNDAVLLSWLEALLADAGIPSAILDSHASIVEGSIGVLPRRLMVARGDAERARDLMRDADIEPPDLAR